MLHTLIISRKISKALYEYLLSKLRVVKVSDKSKVKQETYSTTAYSDIGFKYIKLRKVFKESVMNRTIEILLNPKELILGEGTPHLTLESDISDVYSIFNKEIKRIHLDLPYLSDWSVRRIDYAIDIKTDYVKEYLELFKQCDFTRFEYGSKVYDHISKRQKEVEGTLKLKSKSININFYNKEQERLMVVNDAQGCEGILRLEIQCERTKTDNMKKDFGFSNKNPDHFLDNSLSKKIILEYYNLIIRGGDYYKLDEAIKKVKVASKNHLIDTLKLINQKSSAWEARKAFVKGFRLRGGNNKSVNGRDEATFKAHIRELVSLGINPVTLPKRYKMDFLPNPTTLAFK